ncbi:hypothetical protein ACIBHY_00195 [Nonomuraea sp. NPDC050547]|uniref:hypothetical protein n=1 Tax=Nonomuraea sp. NPDC050547 TaxID=3364368 RepID=UPI0037AD4A58
MPRTTPTTEPDDQASLFVVAPDSTGAVVSGVRVVATNPAASDAALAGDGYEWLAAALPAPSPPTCPTCHGLTLLPAGAPVLWTCPHCHPVEAR